MGKRKISIYIVVYVYYSIFMARRDDEPIFHDPEEVRRYGEKLGKTLAYWKGSYLRRYERMLRCLKEGN